MDDFRAAPEVYGRQIDAADAAIMLRVVVEDSIACIVRRCPHSGAAHPIGTNL